MLGTPVGQCTWTTRRPDLNVGRAPVARSSRRRPPRGGPPRSGGPRSVPSAGPTSAPASRPGRPSPDPRARAHSGWPTHRPWGRPGSLQREAKPTWGSGTLDARTGRGRTGRPLNPSALCKVAVSIAQVAPYDRGRAVHAPVGGVVTLPGKPPFRPPSRGPSLIGQSLLLPSLETKVPRSHYARMPVRRTAPIRRSLGFRREIRPGPSPYLR